MNDVVLKPYKASFYIITKNKLLILLTTSNKIVPYFWDNIHIIYSTLFFL